eukprot:233662-Lingulodinium_polyedra.AAC.1
MASGSFMLPLLSCWRLLAALRALRQCGFCASPRDVGQMGATAAEDSDALVQEEGKWVSWVVGVAASLTRNRLRHLLHYCSGPSLFAALLHEKASVVKWALG